MKSWSRSWVRSKQPRKQRKYVYKAPFHIRQKLVHVHLSRDLREKYGVRAVTPRVGDTVVVLRGQFKGIKGKIREVNLKKLRIYVEGVIQYKQDGREALYPLHPSNLMLVDLVLDDKRRLKHKINSK